MSAQKQQPNPFPYVIGSLGIKETEAKAKAERLKARILILRKALAFAKVNPQFLNSTNSLASILYELNITIGQAEALKGQFPELAAIIAAAQNFAEEQKKEINYSNYLQMVPHAGFGNDEKNKKQEGSIEDFFKAWEEIANQWSQYEETAKFFANVLDNELLKPISNVKELGKHNYCNELAKRYLRVAILEEQKDRHDNLLKQENDLLYKGLKEHFRIDREQNRDTHPDELQFKQSVEAYLKAKLNKDGTTDKEKNEIGQMLQKIRTGAEHETESLRLGMNIQQEKSQLHEAELELQIKGVDVDYGNVRIVCDELSCRLIRDEGRIDEHNKIANR